MKPNFSRSIFRLGSLIILLLTSACQSKPQSIEDAGRTSDGVSGILFVSIRENENWDIYLVQPDGSGLTRMTDESEVDSEPAWSPDGTQIAFRSRRDGSSDIFIMGADGSNPVNLINDPADSFDDEFSPSFQAGGELLAIYTDRPPYASCRHGGVHQMAFMSIYGGKETIELNQILIGEQQSMAWSPDGKFLAFSSICNELDPQLYLWDQAADELTQLTKGEASAFGPAWSPDGRFIAFTSGLSGNSDIWILELATGELKNVTDNPARDYHATWSPDGKQIAFVSNRDGNDEIYVINIDGSDPRNISNNPAKDFWPSWSPVP
jgi:TolB protein